jgi:hypothetical protein
MVVLSITIVASIEEVVSGIPRFITLTTNIPSTIFYTIDGTTPTLFSPIYTGTIQLPLGALSITLNVFATDGIQTSPVITTLYEIDEVDGNVRLPHAGTDAEADSTQGLVDPYPFGDPEAMLHPPQKFENPGDAGFNVNDPAKTIRYTAFDAEGNSLPQSNYPFIGIPAKRFPIKLSDQNEEGLMGRGIGTLPQYTPLTPPAPPETSSIDDALFDPRAMVVYQDFTQAPDPTLPVTVNRMSFTLENDQLTRQGSLYYSTYADGNPPNSGTFLRQHFNPTDGTTTYYYIDTWTNRWVISKTKVPLGSIPNLWAETKMGNGRDQGSNKVYQWVPFKGNYFL